MDRERFVKQNHKNIEKDKHVIIALEKRIKIVKRKTKIEDISEMNRKLLASEEKIRVFENERKRDDEFHYNEIRDA